MDASVNALVEDSMSFWKENRGVRDSAVITLEKALFPFRCRFFTAQL